MKGTEQFQEVIAAYLDQRAAEDVQFAERRAEATRPIEEITRYIIQQVKASGFTAMTSEEVFGLAMTAAEESELEIGEAIPCQVVINRAQLTDDDRAEAKRRAMENVLKEQEAKLRRPMVTPKKPAKAESEEEPALSLFD